MNKFVTTTSGKIGFKKEEYISHTCHKIIPGNEYVRFAEIILRVGENNGRIIKYDSDEEMLIDSKEINQQLNEKEEK